MSLRINLICIWAAASFVALLPKAALSQTNEEIEDMRENNSVLDRAPVISPRAASMSRAITPLADGNDAPYYNPAGIGGIQVGNTKKNPVRQFYFFYAGAAVNENSLDLQSQMESEGGMSDDDIGAAVVNANAGERQFARFSLFPNGVYSRIIFGPIYDAQFAAVPLGNDSDLVDFHYQERTGLGFGFSITDAKENFYIGLFSNYLTINDTQGVFLYQELAGRDDRQRILKENEHSYEGIGTNVGFSWVISKKANPTLSVVMRDLGGTTYRKTKGEVSEDEETNLKYSQDLTIGLGVSPSLGKYFFYNFVIEGGDLENKNVAIGKKLRTGMELNLGSAGSNSPFGIRTGASHAGVSGGFHINAGILGIQYANYPEDVGIENEKVIERRQNLVLSVDLAR